MRRKAILIKFLDGSLIGRILLNGRCRKERQTKTLFSSTEAKQLDNESEQNDKEIGVIVLSSRKLLQYLYFLGVELKQEFKNYLLVNKFAEHILRTYRSKFVKVIVYVQSRFTNVCWGQNVPEEIWSTIIAENGFLLTRADFMWEDKLLRLRNIKWVKNLLWFKIKFATKLK